MCVFHWVSFIPLLIKVIDSYIMILHNLGCVFFMLLACVLTIVAEAVVVVLSLSSVVLGIFGCVVYSLLLHRQILSSLYNRSFELRVPTIDNRQVL
jgi:hypothetical protein